MLNSPLFLIAVGTVLGFLSGLGIGGGSLLMLWLTLVAGLSQETARGINLMFFIPSALIACLFHKKQGRLDIKQILPGILSGCAAAALFSWVGMNVNPDNLRMPFGILLLATGLRELFYRPRKAK